MDVADALVADVVLAEVVSADAPHVPPHHCLEIFSLPEPNVGPGKKKRKERSLDHVH